MGLGDVWDTISGGASGLWDTFTGQTDWNEKAPVLDRGGQYGVDAAAMQQQQFSPTLQAAAMGRGPTAAGELGRQQSEMAQAQARGMAAGNTSGNAGLAMGQAARAGAMGQAMATSNAAQLRAKEQQAARQLYAQQLAQQRQQAFQEAASNQSAELTSQGYRAGMAAGNAQRKQQGVLGAMGAIGGAMMMSDERAKTDVQPSDGSGSLWDRFKAGAGRVADKTWAAYQAEGDTTLPDGSPRHFAVETPEEQQQYYDALQDQKVKEAWAQLQQMAGAQPPAQSQLEEFRADKAQRDRNGQLEMMGLNVPDAPSRRVANRAYRDTKTEKPKVEEESSSQMWGQALKMLGDQAKGGDPMGGIQVYQGSTAGSGQPVNYFSGGGGYDPLSDTRAKEAVVPAGQPPLRGVPSAPGPGATGDFSQARPADPSAEQMMQELMVGLAREKARQDLAKRAGEQQILDALRGPSAPTPPLDQPSTAGSYGRLPSAEWRGGY